MLGLTDSDFSRTAILTTFTLGTRRRRLHDGGARHGVVEKGAGPNDGPEQAYAWAADAVAIALAGFPLSLWC